jgi:hypothetical protein
MDRCVAAFLKRGSEVVCICLPARVCADTLQVGRMFA